MDKKIDYKGLYIQDNDQSVIYYEYGAHFSYKALYNRLELILKSNNKNIKVYNQKAFSNLKKVNSQKNMNDINNKEQKLNISRNSKINKKNVYDKLNNNNNKLFKSKSINQKMELSKSFDDDLFDSFSLYYKNNNNTKNKNNKNNYNNKDNKKSEILIKKNSGNQHKHKILLLNNNINNHYKFNNNKHTVLKYILLPKNFVDKNINENYYGFSFNNNINDSDIINYGNNTSFNSTGINHNYNISKINSSNKNDLSAKGKKIKISSIINKKFIQQLISDSPKSNSSSFIRNNTSGYYYSINKNEKMPNNNVSSFSMKRKHNNSDVDFENKKFLDNNDNYYIKNDNVNNYKGIYNNKTHKTFLLNNNNFQQKNKKYTIFNNFNKNNFHKNLKVNYLNSFKNPILLCEKIKLLNSNKNSIIKPNPKLKSNILYNINKENIKENITEKSNSNSFIKPSKVIDKNIINLYNITSNNKIKPKTKRLLKAHKSYNNVINNIDKNNKHIRNMSYNSKNLDSFTFYVEGENSGSNNKKSRNNNSKNIVNLLCCHFSINFNSPINLLNNIQNNINNNINNKTPKIINNKIFEVNNSNNVNQNNEITNLNNITKSRNSKANIISGDKNLDEIEIKKNKIKKKSKIPINIKGKNMKFDKNNITNSNSNNLNKKTYNNFAKKKMEYNSSKGRLNLSIKKINQK
jgi:hypothetical protein